MYFHTTDVLIRKKDSFEKKTCMLDLDKIEFLILNVTTVNLDNSKEKTLEPVMQIMFDSGSTLFAFHDEDIFEYILDEEDPEVETTKEEENQ